MKCPSNNLTLGQPTPPRLTGFICSCTICKGQSFPIAFILHAWRYSRLDSILLSLCPVRNTMQREPFVTANVDKNVMCWEISVQWCYDKIHYNRILKTTSQWEWECKTYHISKEICFWSSHAMFWLYHQQLICLINSTIFLRVALLSIEQS